MHRARKDKEREFLGWASKPRWTVCQWFSLKTTGTIFFGLASKPVATVCQWFGLKTTGMVCQWFDLKIAGTVFSGLTSKPVVVISPSLASKMVASGFPVWASKPTATV
jgi:hypothetical protein